jgi:hypothetical protein
MGSDSPESASAPEVAIASLFAAASRAFGPHLSKGNQLMHVSVAGWLKRRWPAIAAVLVVALAGFGVYRLHGIFGSNDVVSVPRADSIENSNYNPKHVLFEVFGNPGSVATINYLDEHAQPQRVDNAALPWSHTLTTTDPTLFADLRAQGDADPLSCRITVNGIVKEKGPPTT